VGVVADTRTVLLTERPRPTLFIPTTQASWSTGGMSWIVRSNGPSGLSEEIRNKVKQVAPEQRVERLRPMTDILAATTAGTRFDAVLYGAFAGLALFVSAIGVYGLLAYSVARRTQEVGLRIALGATGGNVVWLILKQGFLPVASGVVLGAAGAVALSRSMSSMLFGVQPTDPLTLLTVGALLIVVGCIAGYFPARRAARLDPSVALRTD
jgi:ABC-type antimicrobial peptide transport system permease subunit